MNVEHEVGKQAADGATQDDETSAEQAVSNVDKVLVRCEGVEDVEGEKARGECVDEAVDKRAEKNTISQSRGRSTDRLARFCGNGFGPERAGTIPDGA